MDLIKNRLSNLSFIKRYSHKTRIQLAIEIYKAKAKNKKKILDFGSGEGVLIRQLIHDKDLKDISLYAYDPLIERYNDLLRKFGKDDNVKVYKDINMIKEKIDIIFCLEVLEHLSNHNLHVAIKDLKKVLSNSGILIISVPIETGLAGLIKNIVRYLISETHKGFTFIKYFKQLLGFNIQRVEENKEFIESHFGFSYKTLEEDFIKPNFEIINIIYSPFKYGSSILNSQIFYVVKAIK